MNRPQIEMSRYTYDLPQERIASYPLAERDTSKLLIYNKGTLSDRHFYDLPSLLSPDSLMVFNNTRVVPARLLFRKSTGAYIEIFCLEPHEPEEYNVSFASTRKCVWKTIVGNKKRWNGESVSLFLPEGHDSVLEKIALRATLVGQEANSFFVEFTWDGGEPFSKVLELCGRVPIPPYLNRESESIDTQRYQTLYARYRGSVAAPTAGLHFTEKVLSEIARKGVVCENVCLHVGAGTFLPVKSSTIADHIMHSEPFSVTSDLLTRLYEYVGNKDITAVGTTSVRTLESLYYLGAQALQETPAKWNPRPVDQWDPYNMDKVPPVKEVIGALLEYMELHGLSEIVSRTRIIIVPSYRYKIVNRLVTNFHQPQSTLLLLIAAFIGEDWHKVYDYALGHGFRFLSYGDSSILMPK